MRIIFLFIVLLMGTGCEKFDLKKYEIINFKTSYTGVGYNFKNDILLDEEGMAYITGTTPDGDVLFMVLDENGEELNRYSNYGRGKGHSIVRFTSNEEYLFITGNKQKDAFILQVDKSGNQRKLDSLKYQLNQQLGLVDSVAILDALVTLDNRIVLTGTLKQSVGPQRMLLVFLDFSLRITDFRTYAADAGGVSISTDTLGNLFVGGTKPDGAYLNKFTSDGIWREEIQLSSAITDSLLQVKVFNFIHPYLLYNDSIPAAEFAYTGLNTQNAVINNKRDNFGFPFTRATAFTQSLDGGFVVAGSDEEYLFIIKYDAAGNEVWLQQYPKQASQEIVNEIIQTPDKGFLVFAISGAPIGGYSFRILKTDNIGYIEPI